MQDEDEDKPIKPPVTRIFSMKSLMRENGVEFDEEGAPMPCGSVRFSTRGRSLVRMKSSRVKRSGSAGHDASPFKPLETMDEDGLEKEFSFTPQNSNWWAEPQYLEDHVAIFIRDAKGLPIKELHHMSSSTYVRIRIQNRGPDGVIKTQEACTRTVHHTLNPFYGQLFFFPLSLVRPDTIGHFTVHNSGVVDGFAGEVVSTFDHYLCNCAGSMDNMIQWYKLQKKRPSDKVSGELCMLMTIVPARIFNVLQWSESPSTLMDPQILNALLSQFTLRVSLERIVNLRFSDMVKADVEEILTKRLQVQVRIGRSVVTVKVQPKDIVYSQEVSNRGRVVIGTSFALSELISVPLTHSFDVAFNVMTKKKQKDEIGDIRIYLMDKRDILTKIQIPIWEIGLRREMSLGPEDESATFQLYEQGKGKASALGISMVENIDAWMKRVADEVSLKAGGSAPGESTERLSSPEPGNIVQNSSASEPSLKEVGQLDELKRKAPDLTGVAMTRAFARPLPSNKGYFYKRRAEPYAFELVEGHPEMQVAMLLVPTVTAGLASAESKEEEDAEDSSDEEEAAKAEEAAPISLPPPLPVMVCEQVIGSSPLSVFDAVFKQEADFRVRQAAAEGLVDVTLSPWESSGSDKERKVTYVRPLSIPIPMAPKKCNVTETHKLRVKEAGGFIMEAKVQTDAPKGDCFFVLIQYAACSEGGNTKLRISFQVEFTKPVGFLKGAIEGGALSSTKKLLQAMADALAAEMSPKLVLAHAPRAARPTGNAPASNPSSISISSDVPPITMPNKTGASAVPKWIRSFSAIWKEGGGDLALLLLSLILVYVMFSISGNIKSATSSLQKIEALLSTKKE